MGIMGFLRRLRGWNELLYVPVYECMLFEVLRRSFALACYSEIE